MKKILLSAIVIISFATYAVSVQKKGSAAQPVISPTTISKNKIITLPTDTPVPPTATPTPIPSTPSSTPASALFPTIPPPTHVPTAQPQQQGQYKDGTYTGSVADAFYGPIQVQVTVSGGKISNVQFLQSPNDRSMSIQINEQADPMLAQEAIQTQSAMVDIISGATDSSNAFVQSMQAALSQAKS